ncbi:MAG: chromosome segregation protein SMC, partial [Alphaproteobacteria bacterium]
EAEERRLTAGSDHAERLAALQTRLEASQAALSAAEAEAIAAEQAHAVARSQEGDARRPLADAERTVQRLDTEIRTLSKVLNVANKSMWPPVVEMVQVAKGYETALGAALGDDLEAPTDSASPQRWAGADGASDPLLPEGAKPLSAFVQGPQELARRLAQVGVVAKGDGDRLRKSLAPGQRLVSPEGDLWRWDGFVVAANAPTAAARRLSERNRLVDLARELADARARIDDLKRAADTATDAVKAASAREQRGRDAWRLAQRAADGLRDELTATERAASAVTTRLAALLEARSRLTAAIDEAKAVKADAVRAIEGLGPVGPLEAQLAEVRTEVATHRAVLAEARAWAQGLTREAEMRGRRLEAIASDRKAWTARQGGAATHVVALETRLAEARVERAGLDDAPTAFLEKRRTVINSIESAESAQRTAADQLASGEAALSAADRQARAALDAMASARETLARAEAKLESVRARAVEVEAAIVETFEVSAPGLLKIAGLSGDESLPDPRRLEDELEQLKRERERLGGVNLRADEELNDVQSQFDGMVAERDDLVEAIKKLRGAIGSLNREGRERLLASFVVVNDNFQRLFTTLFGGGTAELQLVESDDPLEAGLDILAKPPGKRPQVLSLLSGGEQALTAIALIFAVFLTNPAPICVLDEVDAP